MASIKSVVFNWGYTYPGVNIHRGIHTQGYTYPRDTRMKPRGTRYKKETIIVNVLAQDLINEEILTKVCFLQGYLMKKG